MRRLLIGLGIALGTLALLIGGWQLSKSRSFQLYGGLITRVEIQTPLVSLTLDDGPSPWGTDRTLALLDSLDVRATFFVTGHELEKHLDYGRRIVEAGHALGNHSYSHRQMVLHAPAFVRREVERTDSLIREAGWQGAIPFRPPYGKRLFVLPRYLHQTGRSTVLWDVEPESYREVAVSAERIAAHVVDRVRPGSIVLLHVMYPSRAESQRALPIIVEQLRARGYRFVTVQELLAASGVAAARKHAFQGTKSATLASCLNLTRLLHPVPDFVGEALLQHGLAAAYFARPAYQQNDYIGWIMRAKRAETRQQRLGQMLDELRRGGVYMKMDHPPSRHS